MRANQDFTKSSGVNNGKDKQQLDQFQKVFNEFHKEPFTMKMVSVRCNIDRANICWYCRDLRKQNQIKAVRKGICPITRHRATYWTTNPAFFPQPKQMNLFEQ